VVVALRSRHARTRWNNRSAAVSHIGEAGTRS
jgi:hypothetical protein